MNPKDYIGQTVEIKNGIYKGFNCTIKSIETTPTVKIVVDIDIAGKKVEFPFTDPNDLGIDIATEAQAEDKNIVKTFIQNCQSTTELKNIFNDGASDEKINMFKSEIKKDLPEEFFQFYKAFNGTRYENVYDLSNDGYTLLNNTTAILKLADIVEIKKYWDEFVEKMKTEFNPEEKGGPYLYWFWSKEFVPFEINNYKLLAIDTAGIKTQNKFQIIEFYKQDQPGAIIRYNSLLEYFKTMNELIQKKLILKVNSLSIEYKEIYEKINGYFTKEKELFPFEILPSFDWSKIYHNST